MIESRRHIKEKGLTFILCGSAIMIILAVSLVHAGDRNTATSYEGKLLGYINQYRLETGLNALSFDEALNKLAKAHCQHMQSADNLDHAGFDERFKQCGRTHCVENVGWNFETPESQFRAWKQSRGHNENMLSKEIKRAGIYRIGAYVTFFACD